jgi:hypothetical protein
MSVQWAHLPGGETLVASRDGAWLQQPAITPLGLLGPMADSLEATPDTTRHLVDGAIAAAERAAGRLTERPITATLWAWHLVGQWYCAHHGVALLPEVIRRYESAGRQEVAEFARRKLDEELGHDQFPLADLRALGYDAEGVVRNIEPPQVARAEVNFARECVFGEHPIEFLGYVYAQERRVVRIPQWWLTDLATVFPHGVDAASAIRLHAGELDRAHVDAAIQFIATLPADDRTRIVQACHRTAQIGCATFPGDDPTEAELKSRLAGYRRTRVTPGVAKILEQQGDTT